MRKAFRNLSSIIVPPYVYNCKFFINAKPDLKEHYHVFAHAQEFDFRKGG